MGGAVGRRAVVDPIRVTLLSTNHVCVLILLDPTIQATTAVGRTHLLASSGVRLASTRSARGRTRDAVSGDSGAWVK
jgi:hypothetical protein